MKQHKLVLILAVLLVLSLMLSACHGLIPPAIGEGAAEAGQDEPQTTAAPDNQGENPGGEGGEGPGGEGEGEGSGGSGDGGDSEPVVAPEMTGNVVYRFYCEQMKSTSLGGTEQFTAEAKLYDAMNAENVNGVIHLQSGSSETYMTCVWTENEDGTLSLQTDEFNIFEAKELDGVLTIVGIRYSLGMMNSGTVDIPLAN